MNIVYSSEQGSMCPSCGKPKASCSCTNKTFTTDGVLKVKRELKGRKGKGVVTIAGAGSTKEEIGALAKKLKNRFACGGSVKEGVIELQGDRMQEIIAYLKTLGYTVKQTGG